MEQNIYECTDENQMDPMVVTIKRKANERKGKIEIELMMRIKMKVKMNSMIKCKNNQIIDKNDLNNEQ